MSKSDNQYIVVATILYIYMLYLSSWEVNMENLKKKNERVKANEETNILYASRACQGGRGYAGSDFALGVR